MAVDGGDVGSGAVGCGLADTLLREPARPTSYRPGRGVRRRRRRLPRQVPLPGRRIRPGRRHDLRTRMGLLPQRARHRHRTTGPQPGVDAVLVTPWRWGTPFATTAPSTGAASASPPASSTSPNVAAPQPLPGVMTAPRTWRQSPEPRHGSPAGQTPQHSLGPGPATAHRDTRTPRRRRTRHRRTPHRPGWGS